MSTFTSQHTHTINFICDGCNTTATTDRFTFDRALDSVKEKGWRAVRDGEKWTHLCVRCGEPS